MSPWRTFHPGLFSESGAERTRQSCEERAERLAEQAIYAGMTPEVIETEQRLGGQWLARLAVKYGFKLDELRHLLDRWAIYRGNSGMSDLTDRLRRQIDQMAPTEHQRLLIEALREIERRRSLEAVRAELRRLERTEASAAQDWRLA